jgi:hypothetical protein
VVVGLQRRCGLSRTRVVCAGRDWEPRRRCERDDAVDDRSIGDATGCRTEGDRRAERVPDEPDALGTRACPLDGPLDVDALPTTGVVGAVVDPETVGTGLGQRLGDRS